MAMLVLARRAALLLAIMTGVIGASCSDGASEPAAGAPPPAPSTALVVHLGTAVDGAGDGSVSVDVPAGTFRQLVVELDGAPRVVELAIAGGSARLEGDARSESFFRPRPVLTPRLTLALDGAAATRVTVWARGAPVPKARRERSLVWTDANVLDDHSIVSLATVAAAASDDGHGGVMFDRWFRRFATTAHSERTAPTSLVTEVASRDGADPHAWKLDALPFTVTGVHNRLDLARDGTCGELRVSFASTHPIFAPLHLLFLFAQTPGADDRAPDGSVHCLGTARRWARLSLLDGAAFADAAKKLLAEGLRHDRFLLAETVELTVSPWEWRQWKPVATDTLDNPPLFQTVDVESLNAPGPRRDDFLSFVAGAADSLDARTLLLPERFRAPSARVAPGAPRTMLDLTGIAPAILQQRPELRRKIEIVGCPTCHTEHADFVQTSRERVFSPFYDKELVARAARLDLMNAGGDVPAPHYGPLQD